MTQFQHDQDAFEQEMIKAMPTIKSRTHVYFDKDRDGEYTWPEARLAYLAFKLGGHYTLAQLEAKVVR